MLALSLGIPRVQADTAKLTLSNTTAGKFINTNPIKQNNVTWTATTTKGSINGSWQSTYGGEQYGTGNSPCAIEFSTSDISGTITKVAVQCNTGGSATVGVTVGGNQFGSAAKNVTKTTGINASKPVPTYTFEGTASGKIIVSLTGTSAACYLTSIEVTYTPADPEPQKPGAPIFRVNGKDVSGTLTLDIGESETVNVVCDGATSLVFTSPENRTETNGADDIFTIPAEWGWIVSPTPTTITVAGSNEVGTGESSTLNVEFKAPVVTVDAPIFKLADGTTLSGSATVEAGTEITVGSATADATVTLSAEPAGSVFINGVTATVNKTCKLTAVATRTVNDVVGTATSTLDVTVKENTPTGTVYKLINSTDDLVDGMTFVIASNTKNVLMGSKTESHTYLDPVNFTFPSTGNEIEVEDEKVNILTLVSTGTADKWKIKTSDGNYLYWTSGNSLNVGTTPSGNTYVATISFSGDNAKIAFNNQTSQYIQYNSGSPRFACYSTNQAKVQIYVITTPSVATPTFTVADDATFETGSEGIVYYTNPTTVTIATATEGAVLHYTIGDSTDETVTETNSVTLNIKVLTKITAYGTLTDYNDSKKVSAEYHFRTATPVITCEDPAEAQRKTVKVSCATNGATIEYSIDGGTTWTAYPADGIVFDESGKTVNIVARATSALGESETAEYHVSIYPALKWQPFELVTDITKLVPGDEVIFVAAGYDYALAPYVANDRNCKATTYNQENSRQCQYRGNIAGVAERRHLYDREDG